MFGKMAMFGIELSGIQSLDGERNRRPNQGAGPGSKSNKMVRRSVRVIVI